MTDNIYLGLQEARVNAVYTCSRRLSVKVTSPWLRRIGGVEV